MEKQNYKFEGHTTESLKYYRDNTDSKDKLRANQDLEFRKHHLDKFKGYSENMEYYLCLYRSGQCGSWLTFFVNQHDSFPKYDINIKEGGIDVGCYGSDWYNHEETIEVRMSPMGRAAFGDPRVLTKRENATKDFIKVLPNHELHYNEVMIDQAEFNYVMRVMNPKKVILPVIRSTLFDNLLDRWMRYLDYNKNASFMHPKNHTLTRNNWAEKWERWSAYLDKIKPYGIPGGDLVLYLDIGKLLEGDEEEYNKLLIAIQEDPLPNKKELITEYRNLINI